MANPFAAREQAKKAREAPVASVRQEDARRAAPGPAAGSAQAPLPNAQPGENAAGPSAAPAALAVEGGPRELKTAHVNLLLTEALAARVDAAWRRLGFRSKNAFVSAVLDAYLGSIGE